MNDIPRGRDWIIEAQKLLTSLRDIAAAGITLSEDRNEVTEINILAEGHRPAKQIVRDVRSALRAEYGYDVDYRRISVAQKREQENLRGEDTTEPTVLTLPAPYVREEPAALRLCFQGLTVHMDQGSGHIKVTLSLGDREAVGEASGGSGRRRVPRLVAEATLRAVTTFIEPAYSLTFGDLEIVTVGGDEIVLVTVRFHQDREEKVLTGTCSLSHELQQAVVYATLNALNRIMGRLRFREPVEYEIRPSSI